MNVKVYLFAQLREIFGKSQIEMKVPEGELVSGLLLKLQSEYQDLFKLQIRVAVNTEYVENNYQLHDGDEVAIITPVSGG
jgi:molybdopterin synthase sulfur carrier subunit